ncbi:LysR family transcriptional regulator [Tumebacillus permanentifrigoris]|uniref:DNA-binding transcriptional LysR family regulator n=1 Tax=Tumebacillus permanentifrigoris TaxID=378543 RepID=A0A316D8I3_9BACL|nr:LysR family transcriptional regulator [Tumebacillus permanentifrigoris]PWK10238.1 DNA-binding transcriptional LysR family regulator [Tumebacillus permanentifrigoris]
MITAHLLVFVTVAEKKNFSRAAEALSLTQPAISQQIQSLEDYYSTKLFERTSKRVELTRAGELLLPYAKEILNLSAVAKGALDDLVGKVTGKLTIGATFTIGEYILPLVLAQYTRTYPDVEVSVLIANTEEIGEKALNHSIDIGLVEGRLVHRNLTLTPLMEDEMVLFAPADHPLVGQSVTADVLSQERYILREPGSGTRMIAEEVLAELGVHPTKVFSMGSTQSIKEAVEAGMGLAILSKWCIRKELQYGTLAQLSPAGFRFPRPLSVLVRSGHFQTKAVEEFAALVRAFPAAYNAS